MTLELTNKLYRFSLNLEGFKVTIFFCQNLLGPTKTTSNLEFT